MKRRKKKVVKSCKKKKVGRQKSLYSSVILATNSKSCNIGKICLVATTGNFLCSHIYPNNIWTSNPQITANIYIYIVK